MELGTCFAVAVSCFHPESPWSCLHLADHYSLILDFQNLPLQPSSWAKWVSRSNLGPPPSCPSPLIPAQEMALAPGCLLLPRLWFSYGHSDSVWLIYSIILASEFTGPIHFSNTLLRCFITGTSPRSKILNFVVSVSKQNLQLLWRIHSLTLITSTLFS